MAKRKSNSKGGSKLFPLFIVLLLIFAGGGVYGFLIYFEGEKPAISVPLDTEFLGNKSTIQFSASDNKSGLKSISVSLEQGDLVKELFQKNFPRQTKNTEKVSQLNGQSVSVEPKNIGLKDGHVTLIIEVEDNSFRGFFSGNKSRVTKTYTIDTVAPKINILHGERYINPGGSGIFIYRLTGEPVEFGLNLNGKIHPGFLVGDGRDDAYITYFGLPYDAEDFSNAFLYATDKAGNQTKVPVSSVYKPKQFKNDRINVGDGFLNKKIPEFQQYYPEMNGSMVEKYLFTNNQVRKKNNEQIAKICTSTVPQRLWEGGFLRMAGSSRAGFADQRTYYYKGKAIDNQIHLGMDIASTRRAGIKAANKGKVAYADYLGIYGNMVMLDHGQGVFSLYSHLSQINVAVGDLVEKGFVIGQSGTSGMAGGDHLHFSILVNGIFVTPKEWWDPNWIAVTIDEPLVDSKF